jgi:hypothetical protein
MGVVRALHPAATAPPRPSKETVVIHTTREKSRNAGGGFMGDRTSVILPLAGGIAGGAATVLATAKLGWHPVAVAAAATAGGLALANMSKTPWVKQAATGAAIGAGALGGVTLLGQFLQPKPAASQHAADKKGHRAAEGDGFVTRQELQDALGKLADSHKEAQKQQSCDLLTALRDEIRHTIAEVKPEPAKPAQAQTVPFLHTIVPSRGDEGRDAGGFDEYERNAYGDEARDAAAFEERDARGFDEYERNAYGDEARDAAAVEERDATLEERDAEAEA